MSRLRPQDIWLVFLFCLLSALPTLAEPKQPKLIVVVVADQFRAEFLERHRPDFMPPRASDGSPGGFRFLESEAAVHSRCFYDHLPTHTAVGHAAISTGALPSVHGIVSNYFTHRKTGKKLDITHDPRWPLLGLPANSGRGASPRALMAPTLGDALKLQSMGKARVFGVGIKDRAAMVLTGRAVDGAIWFDHHSGKWLSSRFYFREGQLPDYVTRYNREHPVDQHFGSFWQPALPRERYTRSRPFKQTGTYDDYVHLSPSFPHTLKGGLESPGKDFYEAWTYTPGAIHATFEMAAQILENEKLGQDDTPDVLNISLSTVDKVGHAFGPYSPEMQDVLYHLDRAMAGFFGKLDLDNTLIVFTSDHGAAPLPEYLEGSGLSAGRISLQEIKATTQEALEEAFGPHGYVQTIYEPHLNLWLDHLSPAQQVEARALAARELSKIEGFQRVLTYDEMARGPQGGTELERLAAASFYPERTGDLMLFPRPHWIISFENPRGTTHGSAWNYDRHVPLMIRGAGIPAGRYRADCGPRDLAPTLAELLRITPPAGADGRLLEWMKSSEAPR